MQVARLCCHDHGSADQTSPLKRPGSDATLPPDGRLPPSPRYKRLTAEHLVSGGATSGSAEFRACECRWTRTGTSDPSVAENSCLVCERVTATRAATSSGPIGESSASAATFAALTCPRRSRGQHRTRCETSPSALRVHTVGGGAVIGTRALDGGEPGPGAYNRGNPPGELAHRFGPSALGAPGRSTDADAAFDTGEPAGCIAGRCRGVRLVGPAASA